MPVIIKECLLFPEYTFCLLPFTPRRVPLSLCGIIFPFIAYPDLSCPSNTIQGHLTPGPFSQLISMPSLQSWSPAFNRMVPWSPCLSPSFHCHLLHHCPHSLSSLYRKPLKFFALHDILQVLAIGGYLFPHQTFMNCLLCAGHYPRH